MKIPAAQNAIDSAAPTIRTTLRQPVLQQPAGGEVAADIHHGDQRRDDGGRRGRKAQALDLQGRQEADDGEPAAGIGAEAERDGERPAAASPPRPSRAAPAVAGPAAGSSSWRGRARSSSATSMRAEARGGDQPGDAPRRAGQDDGRDQHHRAGAGRHVGRPQGHGQALVGAAGRCAAPGSGWRPRRQ